MDVKGDYHGYSRASLGYILCGSPRSGSTLLCDLLKQSEVAGVPESYFRPGSIREFASLWGMEISGDRWGREYVESVRSRASGGTGQIGIRIMWSNFPGLIERLRNLYGHSEKEPELLLESLNLSKYIYLKRVDKVAQAVSLVLAKQTNLWHLNADGSERQRTAGSRDPVYDYRQIEEELKMLELEESGWEGWFKSNKVEPLRITYEDLSEDPIAVFTRVIKFIGIEDYKIPEVNTKKMSNSISREWIKRFRKEAGIKQA